MRRIVEWATTAITLTLFGVTLLAFDIAGRVVRPFSLRAFEFVMAALQRTLAELFRLSGTTIDVERHPSIRPRTGYVIISNHQSLLDIAMIGGWLFTNFPKYVAKAELGKWIPSISLNLKHGGNALIERTDRGQAVTAITEMAAVAQERNVSVVIFPEGTRSGGSELKPFKRAGSIALLETADRLPVIPTVIDGSWRLHRMTPIRFGSRVRIRFGEPMLRSAGDAEQMLERARSFITSTLAEWSEDREQVELLSQDSQPAEDDR